MAYDKIVVFAKNTPSYWNTSYHYVSIKDGNGTFKLGSGSWISDDDLVWNTAYFAKLMIIAKHAAVIEAKYTTKMLTYVASKQTTDGSFDDRVHISYYCSRSSNSKSRVALTAFVLSAFLEEEDSSAYESQIANGTKYLTSQVINMETYFDMSIAAYAISLQLKKYVSISDDSKLLNATLTNLLKKLTEGAEDTGKYMFWHHSRNQRSSVSSSVQVETASYALLAMMNSAKSNNYMENILKILKWLLSVKNEFGGYHASHDTGSIYLRYSVNLLRDIILFFKSYL